MDNLIKFEQIFNFQIFVLRMQNILNKYEEKHSWFEENYKILKEFRKFFIENLNVFKKNLKSLENFEKHLQKKQQNI